ncbi:MAG: ATP-binding protein [Flammeovirgaceae bacterium]
MKEDHCQFSVSDNGRGIDLSRGNDKKVFGLYQRFHPAIEGKGFGLYLVKTQLEAMGGSISIQSEPGKGTHFHFIIPV